MHDSNMVAICSKFVFVFAYQSGNVVHLPNYKRQNPKDNSKFLNSPLITSLNIINVVSTIKILAIYSCSEILHHQ